MKTANRKVPHQNWNNYYNGICDKQNGSLALITITIAAILLFTDILYSDYPLFITLIRSGAVILGYMCYLLFRLKLIPSSLVVVVFSVSTTFAGAVMIATNHGAAEIVRDTSLIIIYGFVVSAVFKITPVKWIIISCLTIVSYLFFVLFTGRFPFHIYLSNNGILVILSYLGFPYVSLIRYRLYKENYELLREVEFYANNDILTRSFNRRGGLELLKKDIALAVRKDLPLTISFIDINRLKQVNDKQGHAAGDEMIRSISEVIRDNIRDSDTLFRYGGDEFIIIFPDCPESDCHMVMEKIRTAADSKKTKNPISFSYGIAQYSQELSLDDFISLADKKMYKDKTKYL